MQCQNCGGDISEERLKRKAVFCKTACRKAKELKDYKTRNTHHDGLSPIVIGEMSSLQIAADLLKKGYSVFKALSPCSCPLIIMKENILLRVKTRTGILNKEGKVFFSQPENKNDYDILAVITNGNITYEPEITSFSPETD